MLKALACAAALTVCAAGAASAAANAPVVYNIAFTGYCDGMQLNVYKGIYTTGVSTGCLGGSGAYEQGLQTSVNKFGGLVVTGNQGNAPNLYTYALDLTKLTFKIYVSNGTQYALINKGSFTLTQAPANATGTKSTLAK